MDEVAEEGEAELAFPDLSVEMRYMPFSLLSTNGLHNVKSQIAAGQAGHIPLTAFLQFQIKVHRFRDSL